jgi:hypothetical protein
MSLVLSEDAALASRYLDYAGGHNALQELGERAGAVLAGRRGRGHMTPAKAVSLVLAEDPMLKDAVYCYFERT